ncbi:tyrosine-type recombinase/integrase [Neisseria dentiae]|uniref:tyrosine-type recombinase/integrase n=1 Tax=Neisseria dentiae TaxID=194197 RepID=UPI0035A0E939
MPKIVTPLTLAQVKAARARDKIYKLPDGGGLALWVLPSGKKSWRMQFRRPHDGRADTLTLGLFPKFGLADARAWRDEVLKKIQNGQNPKLVSDDVSARYRFENCLAEWFERWSRGGGKTGSGKSEKYARQVLAALELNAMPVFKGRDIRTIKTAEIVDMLRAMERRGVLEYLRRVKGNLNLMFDYHVAAGLLDSNPVAVIGKQVFDRPKERHFAALSPDDLPLLIERLETADGIGDRARLLVYWQLLSMTRPSEAAGAMLSEIDLARGVWEIPIERMKTRPHIVPLSSALLQIYEEAMKINVNGIYLFEGAGYTKPLDRETVRLKLRNKMKLETTAHGLRSLARTYLREKHKIRRDVGELLLSHGIADKTERAYDRSELLEERREALELWGRDVMDLRKKYRLKK